jgi:hypothetical protein
MNRLMVVVALLAFATACGGRKPQGPAWPAASTTAEDGGESLEPRPSASYAAALEKSQDKVEDKKPAADASEDKPAAAATTTADEKKPSAPPETATSETDDILMTDEIVIEIEEE